MVSLKNTAVLVVGASSGIGRSIAVQFAREGGRVMASARREGRLKQLQAELNAEGRSMEVHAADAARPADMEELARKTAEAFGAIDVLVYATGTNTPDRALTRLNPEIWNELITVNLNGAYNVTYAVLPGMRARRSGHLIYIASVSGLMADVSGAAYQASKRGLIGLAHAIRMEEKQNGIRTCAICPGLVDTDLIDRRPVKPSAEVMAKALRPEDVAEMALAVARLPSHVTVPELQIVPTEL